MGKKVRPPNTPIPSSANNAQILALLRSMDARLSRLEDDDDRKAASAAALRHARGL